jgi:phage tail-like protein
VTEDNLLVVGVLDPAGLLVFDLQSGGPPTELPWPAEVEFAPFDMAPRPGGGVFVLDREHALVWELDRSFHVISGAPPAAPAAAEGGFRPAGGPAAVACAPGPLRETDATPVAADAIAVEAADDGGFFVLEDGGGSGSRVSRFPAGGSTGLGSMTGFDFALAGDQLLVVDAAGNQASAFRLPDLEPLLTYYPMRRFGGKGLVAAGGEAHYDFDDRWIPLVAQARPRHADSATIVTPTFDGGLPGCVWHRLMLDARVPDGADVAVWSKAADEEHELEALDWLREPDPRPRRTGSELPFVDDGPYQTHELLFQHPRGRYLALRLRLRGDGRSTPRLRALRAWYPRFSYLEHYLPRVYPEDADSAAFLDRYLANVEGLSTAIEDRIAASQVLLRPDTAPAGGLDWLAGWFDLLLDPLWDERRRRILLANANRFFQARGTVRGIVIALRFALEPRIDAGVFDEIDPRALATARVVEAFRTRRTPGVVFGDPTDQATPRAVVATPRWTPDQGRDVLQAGWLAFLAERGLAGSGEYPVTDPGEALSAPWREFSAAVLGFVPVAPDPAAWGAFLSRRHGGPPASAPPPASLPADGAPLLDWFQFQSVVIPMKSKAHRFTVLLPWPLHVHDSEGDELDARRLRDLAARVVELQKPAHTTFAVKFFWAAFRIGEARLGDDTLLAAGSRVPELVSQAVVGAGFLGETRLAGAAS